MNQLKIPVLYRPEQSCNEAVSYSPSAGKPAQVVADWKKHFSKKLNFCSFDPQTYPALRVHSESYLKGVVTGTIRNGFGNYSKKIADSLTYTIGSIIAATATALKNGTVAVSPTSGFHHASFSSGGGFCTFNGLMMAAWVARELLPVSKKVLILDMDGHYGNGTDDIIERLNFTQVDHITADKSYTTEKSALRCSDLRKNKKFTSNKYGIVLYQAGADLHIDDPLGAGLLTSEQMRQRDRNVFEACKDYEIPLVWNLAGGYKRDASGGIEPVLVIHRATMQECLKVYAP